MVEMLSYLNRRVRVMEANSETVECSFTLSVKENPEALPSLSPVGSAGSGRLSRAVRVATRRNANTRA